MSKAGFDDFEVLSISSAPFPETQPHGNATLFNVEIAQKYGLLLWDKIKNVVEAAPVRKKERPVTTQKGVHKGSAPATAADSVCGVSETALVPVAVPSEPAVPGEPAQPGVPGASGDYPRQLTNTNRPPTTAANKEPANIPGNAAELHDLNDSLLP